MFHSRYNSEKCASRISFTDWLMIAYIALFSPLLSRITALACGSIWVTSFIAHFFIFEYPPKWCTYSTDTDKVLQTITSIGCRGQIWEKKHCLKSYSPKITASLFFQHPDSTLSWLDFQWLPERSVGQRLRWQSASRAEWCSSHQWTINQCLLVCIQTWYNNAAMWQKCIQCREITIFRQRSVNPSTI